MWSPVRKLTGTADAGYLGEWHAARQYVRHVGPAARDMWVWFEADLLPGYAWSFPLPDGGANVGYGVLRTAHEAAGSSKRQLDAILSRPHVAAVLGSDATTEAPLKAWPIPGRVGDVPLSALGGRVLFAGDAARAADPMTGEGIAQALETGELAGRAIARAGANAPARAASEYNRHVGAGLAVDDRLAHRLSAVLARARGADGSVAIAGWSAWTRRNFTRWMFEDYPRAVLVTPHRWQRGVLRQKGAYRALRDKSVSVNGEPA
jgi:flavin-dependent dehydrogenase